MNEILTQEEIDALMQNLAHGQINDLQEEISPAKRVKVYDFRRPNKFSKQQINFLRNIHENYLRALKTYLTSRLNSVINAKIVSIEQITYDEFIRSLPNPTVLAIFSPDPLEGMMMLQVSPSLVFTMIDLLLGGVAKEYHNNRDLTDIEKQVLQRRIEQMIGLFKEAWQEVIELSPQFITLETNTQFTQIVAPNEMVALVTIEVSIEGVQGIINICLPYLVLEPILDKMTTAFLFAHSRSSNPEKTKAIKKKIERVAVELTVELGRTEILVKDLLELVPGDVIPLTQSIHSQLPIYVGDFVKFLGVPGRYKNHMAVQITEVMTEEGDNDE